MGLRPNKSLGNLIGFPSSISKIRPPHFPHILPRPRLLDFLQQHREKRLILILGPAAQGKSTLAVSWITAARDPAAWINLSPEEADPISLYYLLLLSLEQALPDQDFSQLSAFQAESLGPREEIPLYRDWARSLFGPVSAPLRIIFDGLEQLPPEAPAFRFLQVLLDEAPEEVRFLLLSRDPPPLKLEALKVRQTAQVLTGEELGFSLEETREFLKVRRFALPARAVKHIHRITEGWAGGLVLLCEGLARLPDTDREAHLLGDQIEKYKGDVFRYFGEQVFAALPPETQGFLIKSSILEVVEPGFIQDFLGVARAGEILDELAQRNLFIQPLYDKKRGWSYRYHLLFRDFLLAKFKSLLSVEQQRAAYLRAGELSEGRGELEPAVRYFLDAGAHSQAAAAMEGAGPHLLKLGKAAELAQWLAALPQDVLRKNPWLLFYHFMTGRFSGREEYLFSLRQAHSLFQEQQNLRGLLLTSAHLLEISVYVCDTSLPLRTQIGQAEELLQPAASRAFPYESAILWYQVGIHKHSSLEIRQGLQACRRAASLAREAGQRPLEIQALIYVCVILTLLGEFTAAQQANQQVEALLSGLPEWHSPELRTMHLLSTAQLWRLRGEPGASEPLVRLTEEQAARHGLTSLDMLIGVQRCDTLGFLGRYEEMLETFQQGISRPMPMYGKGLFEMVMARFSYHCGDWTAAREFAAQARESFSRGLGQHDYHLFHLSFLEGLVSCHLGEFAPAMEKQMQEALRKYTGISSYLCMVEGHWTLALWCWRQGRLEEAAGHIQAGMEIAARRGSYFSFIVSPRDRGRIFTLALELGVEEVWGQLPPLLAEMAELVGPELLRLSGHANPRIAGRASEMRRAIHRGRAPRLRIQTLGSFRSWRGESPMEEDVWEGNQPKQLLKAILAHGGRAVVRDLLLEDLWPWADPESAEKNFKINLHRLRKSLEPNLDKTFGSSYVNLKANLVSLDPELCQIDVEEFLALLKEAEKMKAKGQFKQAISLYKEALECYGGDFLPEDLYSSWAEGKRGELRDKYLELLHRLAGLYEKQGAMTRAIDCYKQAVGADPLDEPAYQRLMLLLAQRGRRSAALKVYQDCCQAFKKELNTQPAEATTAIYQKILAAS